jgi:hypothetical protein
MKPASKRLKSQEREGLLDKLLFLAQSHPIKQGLLALPLRSLSLSLKQSAQKAEPLGGGRMWGEGAGE